MPEHVPTALEGELTEQLKLSMKAGDKTALAAIRMVRTKIMEKRTAKNAKPIVQDDVVDIIRNYVKQMQGSIDELRAGGADDDEVNLAQMKAEIAYLDRFLPKFLDEAATRALVDGVMAAQGVTDPKQAGRVMGAVLKEHKGRVDPALVQALVKERLGG